MAQQMVVVEHRHPDGGWRQLPPLPRPRRGSGSVRWEGELMVALFGWNEDGVPGVGCWYSSWRIGRVGLRLSV